MRNYFKQSLGLVFSGPLAMPICPPRPPLSPHGGGKKGLNEKRNRLAKEIVPVDEERKKPHPASPQGEGKEKRKNRERRRRARATMREKCTERGERGKKEGSRNDAREMHRARRAGRGRKRGTERGERGLAQ